MNLPVFTAVADAARESALVAAFDRGASGVEVVRRCVDVADLQAAAAAGTAQAVLLSPDLRGLDAAVVHRLVLGGVRVVGVVDDEDGERRLRQFGVEYVVGVEDGPESIAAAVFAAVAGAHTTRALGDLTDPVSGVDGPGGDGSRGEVVAVWGPAGAPGRSTVALGLADEMARAGEQVLLVDADTYGGVQAQALGLLDESPGLTAAARLQSTGALDVPALAGLCRTVSDTLRVLTGITRADRWPEVRGEVVADVLERSRMLVPVTVVDCGFCLEQDEELAYDTVAPRRNGATIAALEAADTVVVVGAADPVGVTRLIRGLAELADLLPDVRVRVVVNRVRRGVMPGDPAREIAAMVSRHTAVDELDLLPEDRDACDKAMAAGRTLADIAPSSSLRRALARLAPTVHPVEAVASRRGRRKHAAAR